MYAEAKNEATGPDASVYKAVNDVRARPGIKMPALPAGLTKDQMRERIRQERRVELALEGLRWMTLKDGKQQKLIFPHLLIREASACFRSNKTLFDAFPAKRDGY